MNIPMLQDYYKAVVHHDSKLTLEQFCGLWCLGNAYNYAELQVELKWFNEPEVDETVRDLIDPMIDALRTVRETHLPESEIKHLMFDSQSNLVSFVKFFKNTTPQGNHSLILEMRGPVHVATELLQGLKGRFEKLIESKQLAISWAELAIQNKEKEDEQAN